MPYFTSTSLTTLVRKVSAVIRHVPKPTPIQTFISHSTQKASRIVRHAINETFPSLSTPSHLLHSRPTLQYAYQPIKLGTRNHRPLSTYARSRVTTTQTLRTRFNVPSTARNGRMVGNVGLGTAKNYSTGPVQYAFQSASGGSGIKGTILGVPVAFGAIYKMLSDEEGEKLLPKKSKVRAYHPYRRNQKTRRSLSTFSRISLSSIEAQLSHYFHSKVPAHLAETPFTVESLITPGTTTTLTLPLSPSLHELLHPTPQVPYLATEIGVRILSDLLPGVIALEEAYSLHWGDKIYPLLARLEDLGLIGEIGSKVELRVELDNLGHPDLLKLVFEDRSVKDVSTLLGNKLEVDKSGVQWWGFLERKGTQVHHKYLNKRENEELLEKWDDVPSKASNVYADQQVTLFPEKITDQRDMSEVELILPTLETSAYDAMLDRQQSSWGSDTSFTPVSTLGLDSTMFSPHSASSGASTRSPPSVSASFSSFDPGSLASSLSAYLSDISDMRDRWTIPPSSEDSDIESAVSDMGDTSLIWEAEIEDQGNNEDDDLMANRFGRRPSYLGGLLQPW